MLRRAQYCQGKLYVRPDTESSYKFATENDIRVISAPVAMFYSTPDSLLPVSTLSDFGEQHQVQTEVETVSQTGSTNKLLDVQAQV